MDYPINPPGLDTEGSVVVWASRFQFAAGEVVVNPSVESRCLIWGNAGAGIIETGGLTIAITHSTMILLPWQHSIVYRADGHDPFMVSAIHIIPWHDPAAPVQFHAAHGEHDPLAGVKYRRDADWPDLQGVVRRTIRRGDPLSTIASFTVDHVQNGRSDTVTLRALAALVIKELRCAQPGAPIDTGVPPRLSRMQEYIVSHLHNRLTIREIASAGGVSESTAERLFRRHFQMAVGHWVTARRMSRARELLRTTNNSVATVGREVGYGDVSYFSRVFRRANGVPPSTYAARSRLT